MKNKEDFLKKIQRDYRIEPSPELLDFWEKVEQRKLHEASIPFRHFFKIKLLTLKEVAEFDFKDLRFWFKKKAQRFLVRYYIPIAVGYKVFVAGYDSHKQFIGVFFCNFSIDPIFITDDLFSLLEGTAPTQTRKEFIEETVSEGLIKEFDIDQFYAEVYDEDKKEQLVWDAVTEMLEYIKMIFSGIHYDEVMEIKTLKKSFKLSFQPRNKNFKYVQNSINIPREEYDGHATMIRLLNLINYQFWNSNSWMIAEYGFYRVEHGVVLLHIEQLCEFIRLGVIPTIANVHFPPIVYSTQDSGYRDILEYEIKFFETQEEYNEYSRSVTNAKDKNVARIMAKKDIPRIVDYFLDTHSLQLLDAGIDLKKIPSEEVLIENLLKLLEAKDEEPSKFYLMFDVYRKSRGHCYIEKIKKGEEAYFCFLCWDNTYSRQEFLDELIAKSIQLFQKKYNLKTIYAENLKKDEFRNEAFNRAGFELVKEYETVRDEMSLKGIYNLWKLKF